MANQTKQEISVETKSKDVQKAATDLWMRPYQEFERFIDRIMGRDVRKAFDWSMPAWGEFMTLPEARMPTIDMIDKDDHILVRAEIPGVDKKDLNVSISENVLTIKGDTKHEEKTEDGNFFRQEISQSSFSRSVTLPVNANADSVNASLSDGVLEVKIGKVEAAKRRSVKVE
jgi:HSP20 family protein